MTTTTSSPFVLRPWEVRAALAGRLSQIRRPVKWTPAATGLPRTYLHDFERAWVDRGFSDDDGVYRNAYLHVPTAHPEDGWGWEIQARVRCPWGFAGDELWCKETWGYWRPFGADTPADAPILYRADEDECGQYPAMHDGVRVWHTMRNGWRSPVTMPRHLSRLTLTLLTIHPARLQSLTESDARANGCDGDCPIGYIPAYQAGPCGYHFAWQWDQDYGDGAWEGNGWVWEGDVAVKIKGD